MTIQEHSCSGAIECDLTLQTRFLDNRGASADNECALARSDSDAGVHSQVEFFHPVIYFLSC